MPEPFHTNPFDDDKLREECGVFGIYGADDAAKFAIYGLHALQHRGQEGCGVAAYDASEGRFNLERHLGLVGDVFDKEGTVKALKGRSAIGHVRYSTAGGSLKRNVQPFFADVAGGGIAIAHNGNLTNARTLREELQARGAIFYATSDTEVIVHLVATSRKGDIVERLIDALMQVEGAYSLVALTQKKLIGVRDPLGVRPLVIGKLNDSFVLASETCAFDIIGATYLRDVEPGEMVVITEDGLKSLKRFLPQRQRFCIFEYVYFARPDSKLDGRGVYEARRAIGTELAREAPCDADIVVAVPDSGNPAAIGFATESNLPFEMGIIRNHYVGRTFIEPTDKIRDLGVRRKHNANRAVLEGKRVVLVDDSIVRGTTLQRIVQMVREGGAREVHVRIASPPTTNPCFYGVDTPDKDKLLAARMNLDVEAMRAFFKADSLAFVSVDGLYRAVGEEARNAAQPQFCDACFTGHYPTALTDNELGRSAQQLSLLTESV
jgi:amidophosphoribosyltransferase